MIKEFKTAEGISTIIEITKEGKVNYSVGQKKTTFDLSDCESITYNYSADEEKAVITEDMLSGTDELEPWMWIVINEGENRLEYNNEQRETRRHLSYSNLNDKADILKKDEDVLEQILNSLQQEAVKQAIKKLDPNQQKLIRDIYYIGLSQAEIAKRDGVHKSSVTKRIKRISKRLKKELKN
ncbi:sigma-70 family RNA polymerase sigma factor [Proteinivorax tanatarense]|uniref:Sigma-70 family RNA polymerase sigma factor n=1 Tax=Proteinivorax tanatarense TaxID=1260629 RepID=A0AAU7VHU0_9FIRM